MMLTALPIWVPCTGNRMVRNNESSFQAEGNRGEIIPAALGGDPRGLHHVMLGPRVQPADRLRPSTHDFLWF